MADHFSNKVIFPGHLFGAIALAVLCFVGLATFPVWHNEVDEGTGSEIDIKPFPSRPVARVCRFASGLATFLALTTALWQHIAAAAAAASMVEEATGNGVSGHIGAAATALAWLGFGFSGLATIGIAVMIYSISVLNRLTDD
ncbi:hypothetical protein LTR78_007751 [Recurvomyces mirabilis]|uniref:Uncharacterized protein n=1 Tax=Recurvomyces mirabilis TaxID=574656 RepID=A0AAE0TRH9_9PEZI|nr:hypothetical protein LTR78_007751 [Recurvomyces mirabilis]KAK5151639.1 hypothetical protein LTS14_009126 [Recurvomyces mirabilis]